MKSGVELIEALALCFGPTAAEERVAAAIEAELAGLPVTLSKDRMGNLTARLQGAQDAPRVMLAAHMDEVGFMVTEIDADGFLHFDTVGGFDMRVVCGRQVLVESAKGLIPGVIAAKGIHLQEAKERTKIPTVDKMYIDIGAKDKEQAEELVQLGAQCTFDTPFMRFGKDGAYICCKALDDRLGCALLIEVLRELVKDPPALDLYFCFTVREEIGKSGASVCAHRIRPDYAIVTETTAIADIPDVEPAKRVAKVGEGGVLSLADRGTIYDRGMIDFALQTAKEHGIPVQIKQYVSGGNDAARIQRTAAGAKCLALSAATRYLHAPASVAALRDYESMHALLIAMLEDWKG